MRALRSLGHAIVLLGLLVIGCAGGGGQRGLYRAQRPSWVGKTVPGYFERASNDYDSQGLR